MTVGDPTNLKIRIDPDLTDSDVSFLWSLYDEAFKRIAKHNPCRQHFHRDEFENAMGHPDYHLIIGYIDEIPVFFCMLTDRFEIIPWIAPEFFDDKFPETIGRRVYIPIIFVNVAHQGLHHFREMMYTIQKFVEERDLVHVFYDHGAEGPNAMLTQMITATPRTEGKTIGTQVYDMVVTFPTEE